jgi:hypothetical protein
VIRRIAAALPLFLATGGCSLLDQRELSGGETDCASAPSACAPTGYRYNQPPDANGDVYYDDEAHNTATRGAPDDRGGFDEFAPGQLVDSEVGDSTPFTDNGKGYAYEWVAWNLTSIEVTFAFAGAPSLHTVRVGTCNASTGNVAPPPVARVSFSDDGVTFADERTFRADDGSLPATIPLDQRGYIELDVAGGGGAFVKLSLERGLDWIFLDEIGFD